VEIGRWRSVLKWTAAIEPISPTDPGGCGLDDEGRQDRDKTAKSISGHGSIEPAHTGRHRIDPHGFFDKSCMWEGSYRQWIRVSVWVSTEGVPMGAATSEQTTPAFIALREIRGCDARSRRGGATLICTLFNDFPWLSAVSGTDDTAFFEQVH
jgi:hypothetical protein